MTLTQLEYIVALDDHQHFIHAADSCFVTQPTLSMGIKKLEEELSVVIFNRKSNPIEPTEIGKEIIKRARLILKHSKDLESFVTSQQDDIVGEFRIGIIPTLSPYLIPILFKDFTSKYPQLKIIIQENQTHLLLEQLERESLDVAIMATPFNHNFQSIKLFDEPFVGYFADNHPSLLKKSITVKDLNPDDIWILNQGHCFREQVINICNIASKKRDYVFESGSIETRRKLVDQYQGYTLIPYLAIEDIPENNKDRIRLFEDPQPVREISLMHNDYTVKSKIIQLLKNEIISKISPTLAHFSAFEVVKW